MKITWARRQHTLFAAIVGGACALLALTFFVRYHRLAHRPAHLAGSSTVLLVKLPFTIPCAPNSSDALTVYQALRTRNRSELKLLLANRRMIAVKKGLGVDIRPSFFGNSALLVVKNDYDDPISCFIPDDIVPVIRKHAAFFRAQ